MLWRNTSGSLIEWLMNGSTIAQSSYVTSGGTPVNPDPSWSFLGAGDFNGDGMSDMLWRNASGEIAEWQMNGTVIAGSGDLNAGGGAVFLGAAWSVAGIGDFNGDGKSDIIWRNASGEVAEWQMNGSTIMAAATSMRAGLRSAPAANWSVAGVGDFNADGNADLLWRDSARGALVEWLMNGSSIIGSGSVTLGGTPVNPDPSWHVVEIGDFNGDARADILWRNDNGAMAEWFMKGTAIVGTATPSSGGAAVTPDASWISPGQADRFCLKGATSRSRRGSLSRVRAGCRIDHQPIKSSILTGRWRMRLSVAWKIAFAMAAWIPPVPSMPTPLMPPGRCGSCSSTMTISNAGMSA